MDRMTMRKLLSICTCVVIIASVAEANYCFRRYREDRNKCRGQIQGNYADAEDCCRRGNGAGWSTRKKGGQCTPCEDILVVEPPEDPWNPWAEWGDCSQTCEEGLKYRQRTCKEGRECEGPLQQVIPCVLQANCPVDGGWGDWDDWGQCSVSCDVGRQYRRRVCNNPVPQFGGLQCIGDSQQSRQCDQGPCPIDGEWSPWSDFTQCSETCGNGGTKRRLRYCDSPAPQFGGKQCRGEDQQIRICELNPCPVDGIWNNWGQWSSCSVTCGRGRTIRRRTCTPPQHGGRDCQGSEKEVKRCSASRPCPVHGGWSEWSDWGRCSAPACTGEKGYQTRSHSCTNPIPRHGGRYCSGNIIDARQCVNNEGCPVHGNWGDWSEWGPCSHTCGAKSFQQRIRECDNPPPQNGGRYCQGKEFDIKDCRRLPACPGVPVDDVDYNGSGSGEDVSGMRDDDDYSGYGSGLE